ncbi:phosphoribosyltransferase family protein [Fulvivirgaceae bacterium BMA10]|uniref:Phosphoribosyltransferase family protein n=1 Tax=Splendidivirga corallicola TaxID=3051826 RepID=A0ABT8KS31_9BACT|nr:phosphoribosyltransferase family protein [Fulvivirgaceae bacterium BMA10]
MARDRQLILNEKQIHQKIRRIAFEIYEYNFNEKELVLAGIFDQGYLFAQLLREELERISPLKVKLVRVDLDKSKPESSEVKLDCDISELNNHCFILADDVLNTGKTLAYGLKSFLRTEINIKKFEIAVLVNRKHSLFPISATYTGYELSTTINEHVQVVLSSKEKNAYLLD